MTEDGGFHNCSSSPWTPLRPAKVSPSPPPTEKPIYFMSGDADPVGDYGQGVEKAYQAFCHAGLHDVTIRLYPDGRHEMLNEINKDKVYQDILNWLNSKLEKL